MGLRELAEEDLAFPMDDWGVPVVMFAPDGERHEAVGQVFSDSLRFNPDTGQEIVVFNPTVVFRRSVMTRIPLPGETWLLRLAVDPGGEIEDYVIDPTRPPEAGRTIGYIKFYLRRAEQA